MSKKKNIIFRNIGYKYKRIVELITLQFTINFSRNFDTVSNQLVPLEKISEGTTDHENNFSMGFWFEISIGTK